MKKFLLGAVSAIFLLAFGVYIFLISGAMPVATKGPPLPLERWVTKLALHAAVKNQNDVQPPFEVNPARLLSGAKTYAMSCAVCHGYPQNDMTDIAKGLFPPPPQFFEKGPIKAPPGKVFWFVKNGIRLTGMPGFVDSLSDEEIWEVTLFLKNTDKLPKNILDFLAN